ncbi:MAG: hypothetical protein JXA67_15690 [Micromonosporaceae bacterium]|nr:hypothetical protein [Micromonosporaceae bacterium]
MAAYASAIENYAVATADALAESMNGDSREAAPASVDHERPPPAATRGVEAHDDLRDSITPPGTQRDTLDTLRLRLDRIESAFDEVDRLAATLAKPSDPSQQTIASPEGSLTATIKGGQIVTIDVDQRRTESLDPKQFGREAIGLFRAVARVQAR